MRVLKIKLCPIKTYYTYKYIFHMIGPGGHLGIKGGTYARYQNLKIPLKH